MPAPHRAALGHQHVICFLCPARTKPGARATRPPDPGLRAPGSAVLAAGAQAPRVVSSPHSASHSPWAAGGSCSAAPQADSWATRSEGHAGPRLSPRRVLGPPLFANRKAAAAQPPPPTRRKPLRPRAPGLKPRRGARARLRRPRGRRPQRRRGVVRWGARCALRATARSPGRSPGSLLREPLGTLPSARPRACLSPKVSSRP